MYRRAVNYLRGKTVVEVHSRAPERVVNLCAAHGVPFWDVDWLTPEALRLTTTRRGEAQLRALAGQLDAELTVVQRRGAAELWRRVRRRYVLLLAAALLPVVLAVGGSYIWGFEISGNDTVPEEKILQALERCGVTIGTPGRGLEQDELRNRVLSLLPDVVYLSVNVRGCTAHVQVVERTRPDHLYRDSEVQNLVAAKDGLITEVRALDGVACVQVGDTVQAGQLLISGVADSPRGARYMRATGTVQARTWYTLTIPVPVSTDHRGGEGETATRFALDVGRKRIKLSAGGSALPMDCGKITVYHSAALPFGVRLPVTLVTEQVVSGGRLPLPDGQTQARKAGEEQLLSWLALALGEDGQVCSTDFSQRQEGAWLYVTLRAECIEEITVAQPLA